MTERKDVTSIPRPDYRKIKHEKRPWRRRWLILSPMDGSLSRDRYAEGVDMDRTLGGRGRGEARVPRSIQSFKTESEQVREFGRRIGGRKLVGSSRQLSELTLGAAKDIEKQRQQEKPSMPHSLSRAGSNVRCMCG